MKPIITHKEEVDGIINIKGENKDMTIIVEGEVFDENILPMATNGVHTRISVINKATNELIGSQYINKKMPKEDLEAQCKLLAKDINSTVNILIS